MLASKNKQIIRKANITDIPRIYQLYKIVATVYPNNLTQTSDEINLDYVTKTVTKGLERGLVLVIDYGQIIGYLKAYTSPFHSLSHVLTHGTMMIHPEWENQGYGHQLLSAYLIEITKNMSHILRFELLPHSNNKKAINFYKQQGFIQESIAENRIKNNQGKLESETTLVWFNPNYPN